MFTHDSQTLHHRQHLCRQLLNQRKRKNTRFCVGVCIFDIKLRLLHHFYSPAPTPMPTPAPTPLPTPLPPFQTLPPAATDSNGVPVTSSSSSGGGGADTPAPTPFSMASAPPPPSPFDPNLQPVPAQDLTAPNGAPIDNNAAHAADGESTLGGMLYYIVGGAGGCCCCLVLIGIIVAVVLRKKGGSGSDDNYTATVDYSGTMSPKYQAASGVVDPQQQQQAYGNVSQVQMTDMSIGAYGPSSSLPSASDTYQPLQSPAEVGAYIPPQLEAGGVYQVSFFVRFFLLFFF